MFKIFDNKIKPNDSNWIMGVDPASKNQSRTVEISFKMTNNGMCITGINLLEGGQK